MEKDLPPCRGVIFDLDGTLLDTIDDLADAVNATLRAAGHPEHPAEAYRRFVGDGVVMLLRRALPPLHRSEDDVARGVAAMRSFYARCWACKTRPYPGIRAMLDALGHCRVPMAVLSNKEESFVQRCVEHFFGLGTFRAVRGARQGQPLKPAPAGALALARSMGCAPQNLWLLGDSDIDVRTARAAGMPALGAAWGFRGVGELHAAGAVRVLRHPAEMGALCGAAERPPGPCS